MAYGDVEIRLSVPPKPAGATESDAKYIEKVKLALDADLTAKDILPGSAAWSDRTDIPESPLSAPAFVETLLSSSTITLSDYTFVGDDPATADTVYCQFGQILACYTLVNAVPKNPANPNEFCVTVGLDNGLSVDVCMSFMVSWKQPFPT